MDSHEIAEVGVDIHEYATQGREIPHAERYRVRVDGEEVVVETAHPTGEMLLQKVGKRACAFELIEEFLHEEADVVEPEEVLDLRRPGLKGFITAHKERVIIFINGKPYPIERGERSVTDILSKIGQAPEGYMLLEEKDGPPLPLPPNLPVKIRGCEIFHSQVQSGGSS
jgi:Multiubiquitin